MPKQNGIQYVQLLRPLMMLPSAPQYLQARPISSETQNEMKPTSSYPFMPQIKSSIIGAHSVPLTTFSRPTHDMSLNMYEYMPAASSRSTTLYNPNAIANNGMGGYKQQNYHHQMMAQRA